jgi:hypothetical protein
MEKCMNCYICKKLSSFVSTESPSGYFVCGNCGYKTSEGKQEFIITPFGYKFIEVK